MSLSERDLTSPLGIKQHLQDRGWTGPSCVVERLAGGFSGFVFRARISNENDDRPSTIIVKHVTGYAARWPDIKIGQDRMSFEAKALEYLGRTYATKHPAIRIPAVLNFDQKKHVLILQDAGDLPTLKSWLQTYTSHDQITAISSALGSFLADIHNTTSQDSNLKQAFDTNTVARNLSSSIYFGNLPAAAEKYGYTAPFIVEAAKAAEAQVLVADEVWTLGDFWPGNVLVSAPNEQTEVSMTVVDFELAKPGTAAFDIGQMGAEMLCLARFRRSESNGLLLLQAFFNSYKAKRRGSVDAAAVAIRIGAHLFTMMPRAWTSEVGEDMVKGMLKEGFDLIKMGWENDMAALKDSVVGKLMD